MITHLLDTSALLAHYFGEPGADEVNRLWQKRANRIGLCVLSLPELKARLKEEVEDVDEVDHVYDLYINQLVTTHIVVDRSVADTAIHLRGSIAARLPLVDAVIAACAKKESAFLVHRDPHMTAIPVSLVLQIQLPEKP